MKKMVGWVFAASALLMACHHCPEDTTSGGVNTVSYASVSVKCNAFGTWTISTGTKGGECHTDYDTTGHPKGGACGDGKGNQATVDCSKSGGEGGCGQATGAGTCTFTARTSTPPNEQTPTPPTP